jgi:transposase
VTQWERGQRPWRYPDAFREEVVEKTKEADANGYPRTKLAEDLGISYWTIKNWAGAKASTKQARLNRQRYRRDAIELHWEGYTYSYIAKQLGIPITTVWEYINREYKD